MPVPRQVKKQVEEADAILAALNSKPGEPPAAPAAPAANAPAAPAAAAPDNNKKPAQPATPQGVSEPPPAAAPPSAPPVEDFEHKFNVLQGKYNSEVVAVRQTAQRQAERITVLEQLIETMKANPPTPPAPAAPSADDKKPGKRYVKPEDIEEYGTDMVEFAQRAAREAVEPELERLRSENARLQQQLGDTTRHVQESARDRLFRTLSEQVPDWQTLNNDQKFLAWLDEADVFSGGQRRTALDTAYNANDAQRVVAIFKAYKREDSATDQLPTPAARTAAVSLETLVAPGTPKGAPSAEAPGDNKKVWTEKEISQFYDKKRRKLISAEEANKQEREIAMAIRENRVKPA